MKLVVVKIVVKISVEIVLIASTETRAAVAAVLTAVEVAARALDAKDVNNY